MSENQCDDNWHGRIYWNELMTRDLEGAKKFYGDICGWTFGTMEGMEGMEETYILAYGKDPKMPLCGLGDMDKMGLDEALPPHWFAYIAVDDIDAAVETARSGNGKIIREPFDVEKIGRLSIIMDSTGAAIGLIQPVI